MLDSNVPAGHIYVPAVVESVRKRAQSTFTQVKAMLRQALQAR